MILKGDSHIHTWSCSSPDYCYTTKQQNKNRALVSLLFFPFLRAGAQPAGDELLAAAVTAETMGVLQHVRPPRQLVLPHPFFSTYGPGGQRCRWDIWRSEQTVTNTQSTERKNDKNQLLVMASIHMWIFLMLSYCQPVVCCCLSCEVSQSSYMCMIPQAMWHCFT